MTAVNADVKRHPIRGALWGLLFGLGLYFLLVGRKVFVLGSWTPVIISLVIGVAVNVLWSMFGPAKAAKPPKGYVAPVEPAFAGAGEAPSPPPPDPAFGDSPPPPVPDTPPPPVPGSPPPPVPDDDGSR